MSLVSIHYPYTIILLTAFRVLIVFFIKYHETIFSYHLLQKENYKLTLKWHFFPYSSANTICEYWSQNLPRWLNSSSNNHCICKVVHTAKFPLSQYAFPHTCLDCWNFYHKLSLWNTQSKVSIKQLILILDSEYNIYLLNESMKFINIY